MFVLKLFLFVTVLSSIGASSEAMQPRESEETPSALPSEDCNRNGIEDAVDIAFGSSSDANGNGVPDECESI